MSGEAIGRLLAAGNVAEVFEYGAHVVKLYKSAAAKPVVFREAAIHAAVAAMGLPVPGIWGVRCIESRWGIIFDRLGQASFADRMRADPDAVADYLACMARLQVRIHGCVTSRFAGLKHRLAADIAATSLLDEPHKQRLLADLPAMPDGDRVCHGDFHPLNILGDIAQPVVIDWPDASRGDPAADACRSYLLLLLHARELAPRYLDAYCRVSGVARAGILAWLPYVAAAKLNEHVPGEQRGLLEVLDADRFALPS